MAGVPYPLSPIPLPFSLPPYPLPFRRVLSRLAFSRYGPSLNSETATLKDVVNFKCQDQGFVSCRNAFWDVIHIAVSQNSLTGEWKLITAHFCCFARRYYCYVSWQAIFHVHGSLQCRRFLRASECFCSRKRHVETHEEKRKWGESKGGLLFLLSLIFLRYKIKDGGYNDTNIKEQLSPAQNTPALQAMFTAVITYVSGLFWSLRSKNWNSSICSLALILAFSFSSSLAISANSCYLISSSSVSLRILSSISSALAAFDSSK